MKSIFISLISLIALLVPSKTRAQVWALPIVSETSLRSEPRHSAEQVSQVVLGTPLRVLNADRQWWKVESPEGYRGFVRKNTLKGLSDAEMQQWRKSDRYILLSDRVEYLLESPRGDADRVCDLPSGAILISDSPSGAILISDNPSGAIPISDSLSGGYIPVRLADGRRGYVASDLVIPLDRWAAIEFDPEEMPRFARRLMGAPYVWGGTSLKGMDCSGLTQISAYRQGVILPRDASQQVKVLTPVDKSDYKYFRAGDLLFFGNTKIGKINHVAISMGVDKYIHSSGRVRISSLAPGDAKYENPGLIAVGRITPQVAQKHSASSNPFYF